MHKGLLSVMMILAPSLLAAHGVERYPDTRRSDTVDDYHGTKVADPYRWLEGDVREKPEVADWVARENTVTDAYLATLTARPKIRARLEALWNYERFGVPVKAGDAYFMTRNDGLQNQAVLYVQHGLDGEPRVLIDPNTWAADGTIALAEWVPSPDGRYLAYGIQDGGSDWRTWRVIDVATGKRLADELQWLKFTSAAWTPDNRGFFYSRYPAPAEGAAFQSLNTQMAVYYHRLGTAQDADELVYADADHPEWGYAAEVTDDGRYLVVTVWVGTDDRYQILCRDLTDPASRLRFLVEGFDHAYQLAGNDGNTLYFRSSRDATRYRVLAVDPTAAVPEWREIVAEQDDVLESALVAGGKLVLEYLHDAASRLEVRDRAGGTLQNVALPGLGSVTGLSGKAAEPDVFFSFASFNRPPAIYRLTVGDLTPQSFKTPKTVFDPGAYTVEQVFYRSKDGTRIPMFITRRQDLDPNTPHPTLLYGYGGFNISLTPTYSPARMAWLEMGGVLAVANLRGGGEYGEAWHKAGTKTDKQNVFDDFIAAAEDLIARRVTTAKQLVIQGGSNGGLLVGAVLNQRPELYAAALPAVGVMDMLRFQYFTAGRFWVDDYGSSADPEEFKALYAYSPYHNIKSGTHYPAVLATTADYDDRVVPGHSFKYIAALQAAQAGDAPVLIRIETRAGHGAGKPTAKQIDEAADLWAFAAHFAGLGSGAASAP